VLIAIMMKFPMSSLNRSEVFVSRIHQWLFIVGLFLCIPGVSTGDDFEALKKQLEIRFNDLKIREIRPTPVAGMYEIVFGTQVAYVTADGHYMLTGNLVDLETRRNLSGERRADLIKQTLSAMSDSKAIVFAPKQTRRTITVFTDVDCPYCAKFHKEVPALNSAGIKVRYLLFPRSGKNSESYKRAIAVWCAKDRNQAIGVAKAGGKIEMKTCPNPVDSHLALGEEVGVTGTPTIVLDDGRVIPGYVPAAELARLFGFKDDPQAATAK